ncbi:MAG: transcriptional regulator [Leifsonia sp.]|nr:transcriptional regulator [Leifsonia sp.]|tara:strand:+ start:53275 stop:54456 length:1182 start_codon:yes stop_codon:yes gene_type:complete
MVSVKDGSDGVRRRNLAAVLTRVHRGGPASRAILTAEIGLNRSTIGALVAELEGLGLVEEGNAPATRRVGRPSPVVRPHPRPAVVAVNPELDAVTVAIVGLGARVEHRVRREVDHPVTALETAEIVAEAVDAHLAEAAVEPRLLGVGLAVPGLVRASDGVVRWAPHLGWQDEPIAELVGARLGLPTVVDNDASLGALAERIFGAGRGVEELVYLNGGASGIGGGVIVRGQLLGGANGYAGEFGQNRPGLTDSADRVTEHGTLEDEVSRARLLATLGLTSADEPQLERALLAADDPAVAAEVARQQRVLAVALGNAINVVNPELVVLGGFLASLLACDPVELERTVAATTVPAAFEGVRIQPAALGEDRLLIGAAELAWQPILSDPASAGSPRS